MLIKRFYKRVSIISITISIKIDYFFEVISTHEKQECPICLEITQNEKVLCHQCRKMLDLECTEKWFKLHSETCPYCRSKWIFIKDYQR
jgi:hypothetical protein